ncbi:MAG: D-alanyl-D-alanine carboxypeptidase [Clostridia bacterium]|nr:D-alanyl-D-alanine carboxypeptidase [Clostridia bacterium]
MFKKLICVINILAFLVIFSIDCAALDAEELSALSAVVYCTQTGEVIFEKNADDVRSMASTTKIMTSLIALECNTPHRVVEITEEMADVEGTSSGLEAGDRITLENLVYCMLLESGNDAANAVALAIGGSFEAFADMMNKKAKEIGMENTSFVTPSGLDDDNHYTTAYDMALLTAYALENPDFVNICSQSTYNADFISSGKTVTLSNHNRLIKEYEGCFGVKTGFTKKSGRCLVSAAERDGVTLIAVTLNAGDDWNDHRKMLDYGFECVDTVSADTDFSQYSVPVIGSDVSQVGIECADIALAVSEENQAGITRKIYLQKFLYAPVAEGDIIGMAEYYIGEKLLASVPLTADRQADIIKEEKINFTDRLLSLLDRWWKNGG